MSQTAPGETGGGGNVSHSSRQFFQQPIQVPGGAHFFPQGQGGAQYGSFSPRFPVKPTNPHIGNGYRVQGPIQRFNIHSSHMNSQHQQMHFNAVGGQSNVNVGAMNSLQPNQCENMQYLSDGNRVAAFAVNQSNQNFQNQQMHAIQQQYIQQAHYGNSNQTMVNHMNLPQNMCADINQNNKDSSIKNQQMPISNLNSSHEGNLTTDKQCSPMFENNFSNSTTPDNSSRMYVSESGDDSHENTSSDHLSDTCNNNMNNNLSVHSNSNTYVSSQDPRSISRDSLRSEAAESTCSSLGTDSIPDQMAIYPNDIANITPNIHQPNQFNYQMPMNSLNEYNMQPSENMNFQGFAPHKSNANVTFGKSMYNHPNMQGYQQVNTFHHVQVQHGVQIMQQYQSMQRPGVPKHQVGFFPNAVIPHGQVNATQGQPFQGVRMPIESNMNQNVIMPTNCLGHSGTVPVQNFNTCPSHGQFPHPSLVHSHGKITQNFNIENSFLGPSNFNKNLPPLVVVPFGWKRLNNNGHIVYVSPCGSELRNLMEVCTYLTQENTCKCGLQCPLRVENIFCFDPEVPHRLTMPNELSSGDATKMCTHRRKLAIAFTRHLQKQAKKEDGRKKRKRKVGSNEPMSAPSDSCSPTGQVAPILPQSNFPAGHFEPQIQQQYRTQNQAPGNTCHHDMSQNWTGMYGGSRPLAPNSGMIGVQGNVSEIQNMAVAPGVPGPIFPNQSQNCCENVPQHHCLNNYSHNGPHMFPGMRPVMGTANRPQFSRMPSNSMVRGIVNPQQVGAVLSPPFMHQQQMGPPTRMPTPNMPNNLVCRMPQMNNNLNIEPVMAGHDKGVMSKAFQEEESQKRRRSTSSRSRKKAKNSVDVNSPTVNDDSRSGKSDSSTSIYAGPGPPISISNNYNISSNSYENIPNTVPVSGPSFMDDPNGYLAQQTVLLNNTMSGGGVGQFSPQEGRISPKTSNNPTSQSITAPTKSQSPCLKPSTSNAKISVPSSIIVPLPSNVILPARVSKTPALTSVVTSIFTSHTTNLALSSSVCSSVHSKSSSKSLNCVNSEKYSCESNLLEVCDKLDTWSGTVQSSSNKSTVTVTYTNSSSTLTSCRSGPNSPHSSQETVGSSSSHSIESTVPNKYDDIEINSKKSNKLLVELSPNSLPNSSQASENKAKKSDVPIMETDDTKIDLVNHVPSRSCSIGSTSGLSSIEDANKPLTPGPAESSLSTQSPLEMVQNIISSIPLPASSDESPSLPMTKGTSQYQYSQQPKTDQHVPPIRALPQQQILGPQVFNVASASNMNGLMYNPNVGPANVIRGNGSLVVHGPAGSIAQGVLVSNNSVVVVTSPFNTKVSVAPPVVCTNVTGMAPVMGVQTVPSVQLQPSIPTVSSQVPQHLQQIQSVQPVVQFVNPFAAMQGPVIIQNGSNIIQSSPGVLSGPGGVIGSASILPSSAPTFLTGQQLVAVDTSHNSPNVQVTQVVTSSSSDSADGSASTPYFTPVSTPATTPTTPHSTLGSETPPSGGSSSSGGGRKRKRKRNTSTPQGTHQQPLLPQQNIVPTFIMGKQMPSHQVVMSGAQISQVTPYAGTQMATVAVGASGTTNNGATGQIMTATSQSANPINVVQMVGGAIAGPLPVQLQQPHTILLPSTPAPGVIINQLPDGTFVSTDPNTGLSYPVQLQLSGSQIVGITPLTTPISNSSPRTNVVASISVRQPVSHANTVLNTGAKIINISPPTIAASQGNAIVSNVYNVSANPSVISNAGLSVAPQAFSHPLQPAPNSNSSSLQQPLILTESNATLLQQKTTTIVAQQTTVVATQKGLMGTHSSVSTQTPGVVGESDVSSSDCVAPNANTAPSFPISPSHQSAEVTTTKQDEDAASTPESLLVVSPPRHQSPGSSAKNTFHPKDSNQRQEPHSALTQEVGKSNVVYWGFHRGHHYWPARILRKHGGDVTVEWFGDHQIEKVSAASLSQFGMKARKVATRRSNRDRRSLDEAIREASESPSFSTTTEDEPLTLEPDTRSHVIIQRGTIAHGTLSPVTLSQETLSQGIISSSSVLTNDSIEDSSNREASHVSLSLTNRNKTKRKARIR